LVIVYRYDPTTNINSENLFVAVVPLV